MDTTTSAPAEREDCLVDTVAEAGALLGISRAFRLRTGRPRRAPGHSPGPPTPRP